MKTHLLHFTLCGICLCMFAFGNASAAPQASKTAGAGANVLQFPSNYSLGELYLVKPDAGSGLSDPPCTTHSPARGPMRFPPGTKLLLKVRFEGAQHLADLDKLAPDSLYGINLKRLEFTDDDLKHIGRLTGLRHLELEGTDTSDKGVINFETLKNLQFLGIDKTMISGAALKSIGKHTALVNLVIGHNSLDDESYKYLIGLKNIVNLQVDFVHMSDKAVDYIKKIPSIRVLKICGNNRITDAAIAKLQASKIEMINAQQTGVGPDSLAYFSKMPRLQALKLEAKNFSPAQKKQFRQKLPKVSFQFAGKEKNLPEDLFEPLH